MAADPDRMIISTAEYERLKAAEDTCWSLCLVIGLGLLEDVPKEVREHISKGGLEQWTEHCDQQGLLRSG